MQSIRKILAIDDQPDFLNSLESALRNDFKFQGFCSYNQVTSEDLLTADLVLMDIRFQNDDPENRDGIKALERIKKEYPALPVVMITAFAEIDTAIKAIKIGAADFLLKGQIDLRILRHQLNKIIDNASLTKQVKQLEKRIERYENYELVGTHPGLEEIKNEAISWAQDGYASVLIQGETGTGKELLAHLMHRSGKKKSGPFVAFNISALSGDMVQSELFGYVRGAFTGASTDRRGLIEEADGGILFLDEIADLTPDAQVKLLRVLQDGMIRRLGGNKDIKVDFQLIAATNKDLAQCVSDGTFREDLYFRIKQGFLVLPPLRDRKDDIPVLADYFLERLKGQNRTKVIGFAPKAQELLKGYFWPGNVRELDTSVLVACNKANREGSEIIETKHLPIEVQIGAMPTRTGRKAQGLALTGEKVNLKDVLGQAERDAIVQALKITRGNKDKAWKMLGYGSRYTFWRRLKVLNISIETIK